MIIIQLIQSQPQRYKLDGKDTLRFYADMPEASDRITTLNALFDDLSASPT